MSNVSLITGASRGIGKSISHYFSKQGDSLILISLNKENIQKTQSELNQKYSSCNIEAEKPFGQKNYLDRKTIWTAIYFDS